MSSKWLEAYNDLKSFIGATPGIEITPSSQCIPANVRTDFYHLFDNTRLAFIKEYLQGYVDYSRSLSQSYNATVETIIKHLGVDKIKPKSTLQWFLNDPLEGLSRLLFNLLFDLLKGKLDTEDFEEMAKEKLEQSFPDMFRDAYEHWVFVGLLSLLDGDKAMTVPLYGSEEDATLVGGGEPMPGTIQENISSPQETSVISLEHAKEAAYMVPDIIISSKKLGGYASIRRDLYMPQRMVKDISLNREWLQYREVGIKSWQNYALDWPDMVMYAGPTFRQLSLVADYSRFCRPEIIIECVEQDGWFSQQEVERIKRNQVFFRPKCGVFVICRGPIPDEAYQAFMPEPVAQVTAGEIPNDEQNLTETDPSNSLPPSSKDENITITNQADAPGLFEADENNIHLVSVGYEVNLLAPVVEALIKGSQENPQ